ncbi:hypothetical protein D3C71_1197700 [compost metagenome]
MGRLGAQRHQAVFAALAQHHAHHAFIQADVQRAHAHQFGHTQTGGVQRFQHGAVAQAARLRHVGRAQQGVHLLLGQGLGQARRLLGGDQGQAGVAFRAMFAQRPGKEAAQRGQAAVGGGGAGFFVAEGEPGFDVGLLRVAQRFGRPHGQCLGACRIAMAIGHFAGIGFRVFQPAGETGQVAAVGGQRVGRQAVFQPHGVDESVDIGLGGKRWAGCRHALHRSPTPAAADFSQVSKSLSASDRSLRCG